MLCTLDLPLPGRRYGVDMSATSPEPSARPGQVSDDRTPAQIAHERAMTEVSETLMNVEQAIRRVKKAQGEVARVGYEGGAKQALDVVLADLVHARDRLFQASYLTPAPGDRPDEDPASLFPDLETPLERQLRLG